MEIGTADGDDLQFELDPEALCYTVTDYIRQCKHIGGPRPTEVADEVGVLQRYLGCTALKTLQTAGIDQPSRRARQVGS